MVTQLKPPINRITRARAELDLSMTEFAARCGLSMYYLGLLERDRLQPTPRILMALARGCGIDFDTAYQMFTKPPIEPPELEDESET